MKKIIVVINKMSGNGCSIDTQIFVEQLKSQYEVLRVYELKNKTDVYSVEGADVLAICGGDGTLSNAIEIAEKNGIEILYSPCGTLNESQKANAEKNVFDIYESGMMNNVRFAYVAATGIFTRIGYATKNEQKQKLKFFAYWLEVLKSYKVEKINAKIETDKGNLEGDFTLIMFIDSSRCFGFKFNKLFVPNDKKLQLLTIKTPKCKGLFAKIAVFFPLFRAFFVGFGKEHFGNTLNFWTIEKAKVVLDNQHKFCIDGEEIDMAGEFEVNVSPLKNPMKYNTKNSL